MEYISTKDAANKWGISLRLIQGYCVDGKIPGAKFVGRQWMIPVSAACPVEKRYQHVKVSASDVTYHFPDFVHSCWYTSVEELNDEEKLLRKAQILICEGKFIESINLCRSILESSHAEHILIGAYLTIAYNSLLLGRSAEIIAMQRIITEHISNDVLHSEDYRLLALGLDIQISRQFTGLLDIDISKLSPDALHTYRLLLLQRIVFSPPPDDDYILKENEIFCRTLEHEGIIISAVTVNAILAWIYSSRGNNDTAQYHIEKACTLAVRNNLITIMSKYSTFIWSKCEKFLGADNEAFLSEVKLARARNIKGWETVHNSRESVAQFSSMSPSQLELAILLSYNFSNKKIAATRSSDEETIKNEIHSMCRLLNLKNKAELVKYSKDVLLK